MNGIMRSLAFALLVSGFISACAPQTSRSPVSTLAIKAAIDSLWTRYAVASDQRDPAAFGALFTEDATLMYSGAPTASGREAIQTYLASRYSDIDATGWRVVPDETRVSDLLAVQGGTFEGSFLKKDKPMMELGRYTLVAEIQPDHAWKIARLTAIVDSTIAAP